LVRLKLQLKLFSREILLFTATLLLGLFSAYRILGSKSVTILPGEFNITDFIVLGIFIAVLVLARNKRRFISFFYRCFLILIIFTGSQLIFGAFFVSPFDLMLSLIFLTIFFVYKNVLIHNIGIILGIAGVSAAVGLSITPKVGVILLIVLSFYDIISVYKTKHMIHMAKSMIQSGAIFGFIVPPSLGSFLTNKGEAQDQVGQQFMILGSGDIGLPLIMVCSLVRLSLGVALITGFFSLIGLFFTHLIFVNQTKRSPMAALPPIATMTIIGYVIAQSIIL